MRTSNNSHRRNSITGQGRSILCPHLRLHIFCQPKIPRSILRFVLWCTRTSPKAPADLVCYIDLHAKLLRETPHQGRIFLKCATNHNNVKSFLKQLVRLFAGGDATDRADDQPVPKLLFDSFCKGLQNILALVIPKDYRHTA